MSIRNLYSFEVEFFTNRHSIEKIVTLTAQETANLYRWTFQLPLSAPVDLNEVTEAQFEEMTDELEDIPVDEFIEEESEFSTGDEVAGDDSMMEEPAEVGTEEAPEVVEEEAL